MAVPCLHTFFLRSHNCQVLPLVTRGLLPHVLKCINKMYLHSTQWDGVLKQSRGGDGIIQISQKEKLFQSHKKLSASWDNLTILPCIILLCLFQKRPSSFLQFGQVETIHGHLSGKIFLICFSLLSPQAESKEDNEHFCSYPQICKYDLY